MGKGQLTSRAFPLPVPLFPISPTNLIDSSATGRRSTDAPFFIGVER